MKIRTGFVTNSSSYSSAVIRIQSKQLTDLLKEYKEMFGPEGLYYDTSIRGNTFYVDEDEIADQWKPPRELDEVLDRLISGLGRYNAGSKKRERKQELLEELMVRKQELTDSIKKVSWTFQDDSYGEFEESTDVRVRKFTYDQKQGGTGTYKEK